MPSFAYLLFIILSGFVLTGTIIYLIGYIKTKEIKNLIKLGLIWVFPIYLIFLIFNNHHPINKKRIIGTYKIDTRFYPGPNADWQHNHFWFEITQNNQFLFHEKLKDGSTKTITGKVEWYTESTPTLFRIHLLKEHPLIDLRPTLYRGNKKFYYVFESEFGNMFYRKIK